MIKKNFAPVLIVSIAFLLIALVIAVSNERVRKIERGINGQEIITSDTNQNQKK